MSFIGDIRWIKTANSRCIIIGPLQVTWFPRIRARWFGYELYRGDATSYFNVWFASPNCHAWWARDIYFYWNH